MAWEVALLKHLADGLDVGQSRIREDRLVGQEVPFRPRPPELFSFPRSCRVMMDFPCRRLKLRKRLAAVDLNWAEELPG